MITRNMTKSDLFRVRELHQKYYSGFNFPNFMHLLNAFIIEDEEGIIMAGGIEAIANGLLVTNKERSRVKIGRALIEAQNIALFTAKRFGIKEIIAFVDNEDWAKHLIKHGFSESDKIVLYMRLPDGSE